MVNENFKKMRGAIGVSQGQLAEALGIIQKKLSKLETGETKNLDPGVLRNLIKRFNVNVNFLLTGEGPIFEPDSGDKRLENDLDELHAESNEVTDKRISSQSEQNSKAGGELEQIKAKYELVQKTLKFAESLIEARDEKIRYLEEELNAVLEALKRLRDQQV